MNSSKSSYRFSIYILYSLQLLLALFTLACSSNQSDLSETLVINELMASNHSSLVSDDGMVYDWVEIKNVSSESVSLDGITLVYTKSSADASNRGKSKPKTKSWSFPQIDLGPDSCIIVFASKQDKKKHSTELHSNFSLSSSGGILKLLSGEDVISSLKYGALEDDECLRRLSDGRYEKSYMSSPGYENDSTGYEQSVQSIDKNRKGPLRLWELHTKGYKDGNAWIEIKNISSSPVSLQDYCLTTSTKDLSKWHFPSVDIQPNSTYVVNCRQSGFKPGSNKSVMLTHNGKFIDGICSTLAPYGVSVGRSSGESGLFYYPSPTKGSENTGPHYRYISKSPTFSPTPGVYPKGSSIKVRVNGYGHKVHYTTDGSAPSASSPVFPDSLTISQTTTIRSFCEGDSSSMHSVTVTNTFILDEEHTLPVFNVTIKPSDMYDYYTGIYEKGPGASPVYPHSGANYWKKWWKKAHIEFFDGDSGFSEDCEMAIFGGFSRTLSKKSFKIRFKDSRGPSSLTYDLYGTGKPVKFKKFLLRSGSQDIGGVMVRDEFFTSLVKSNSPTLLVQAYRPAALYINGEYFGLYYIREKIDKDFVASHLNVSNDSISIIFTGKYTEEGSISNYNQLMSYVRSHNMAEKEHYDYVKSRFELLGLIDYKLAEFYSCNTDIGNVRYVRSEDAKGDRKWHVILYDLDISWGSPKSAAHYLRASGPETIGSTSLQNKLISELLKNKEFRNLFLERFSMHLHKTFSTENATSVFDKLIKTISPEMKLNCARWPKIMSYSTWEKNVEKFREKFKERNRQMLEDIRKELSVSPEEEKKYFSDLGY